MCISSVSVFSSVRIQSLIYCSSGVVCTLACVCLGVCVCECVSTEWYQIAGLIAVFLYPCTYLFIYIYIYPYTYLQVLCYKSFSCAMLSPGGSGLQDHSKIVLCSRLV